MKKLLFFASDYRIGLSAVLTDQLLSLIQAGVDTIAVAGENEQEPNLRSKLKEHHINLVTIDGLDAHHNINKLSNTICKLVKENNIDVIHVQNNWQLAIAGLVKSKLFFSRKLEIVYTIHGFRNNQRGKAKVAQYVIGSGLFLIADKVICMSKFLESKFSFLKYKIKNIPLGIDDSYFSNSFSTPTIDHLNLTFPAQFREGKMQDLIIKAFHNFVNLTHDSQAMLTLPGDGERLAEMKLLAKELGIAKQVCFPGMITKKQVKDLYLNCNLAIVASMSETFGQSIVEPFILGRCIVSTPVGIAPELIKEGYNGYIFKSETDLTNILLNFNANKNVLISIGKNNFAEGSKFRWKEVTSKYVQEIL